MNILMIDYEYPPLGGGGGVLNKLLAEALVERGHSIALITSRYGNQPAHETQGGVELFRVPVPFRSDRNAASLVSMLAFFPSSLLSGIRILRKRRFDVIHSMFAVPSGPSGLFLSGIFHKPHVVSLLGGDIYDPSKKLSPHRAPMLHQTVGLILRRSDAVVTMSRDIRRRALKYFDVQRDIALIPHGIPEPHFVPAKRASYGFDGDDILLITVGRLVRRKAVHELIQAIARLADGRVKLLVIGDGPQRGGLEQTASDLNVTDQVFFFGNVNDNEKFALLDLADIYVSASWHEGFGIVFLEAMATGLPVVCYDNGGQVDFLGNGRSGVLVPVGKPEQLADRIRDLILDPGRRRQMADFNRRHVRNFFIGVCAQQYEAQYRRLTA